MRERETKRGRREENMKEQIRQKKRE